MAVKFLHHIPMFRHFFRRPRLLLAIVFGILLYCVFPMTKGLSTQILLVWDSSLILYLILVTAMMLRSDQKKIITRANAEDEGGFCILSFTILTAVASLAAIVSELANAKELTGADQLGHIMLAALTVFLSWLFMHTMFALHYAHEYYGNYTGKKTPSLDFPGKGTDNPDYWDFVYFSFILGTAAQTADVAIVSKIVRRIVTLHCVIAFFFNTTILALTINIGASLLS